MTPLCVSGLENLPGRWGFIRRPLHAPPCSVCCDIIATTRHSGRISVFLTGPHSPSRLSPPVCFRPTHPPFLQALASSCAGATSWLPVTCERIRCPHLVRVVQLPVSHPIACALPVPPCLKSCGFHHWPPTCQPIVTPCCLGGFEVCTPRGVCGRCRIRTCCSSEAF